MRGLSSARRRPPANRRGVRLPRKAYIVRSRYTYTYPVPPARLARGGPVRVAQGLHGASLPLPPRPRPLRRRWHGRPGVTAAWRLCAAPSAAGASAPASRAGCTFAGSYGGKGEGKGKVRGGGGWCLPHRAACPSSPPFSH